MLAGSEGDWTVQGAPHYLIPRHTGSARALSWDTSHHLIPPRTTSYHLTPASQQTNINTISPSIPSQPPPYHYIFLIKIILLTWTTDHGPVTNADIEGNIWCSPIRSNSWLIIFTLSHQTGVITTTGLGRLRQQLLMEKYVELVDCGQWAPPLFRGTEKEGKLMRTDLEVELSWCCSSSGSEAGVVVTQYES